MHNVCAIGPLVRGKDKFIRVRTARIWAGRGFDVLKKLRRLGELVWMLPMFFALALCLAVPAKARAQEAPPRLDLQLRPVTEQGRMDRVEVEMRLESPDIAAGDPLLRLPLTIVSIPTSAYEASAIRATDAAGPLELASREEEARPEGVYRQYVVPRATRGDVSISYVARPRTVSASTNNGPLFDMREENGGFTAAGISFLAVPVAERPWRVSLKWDLEHMPDGSMGVWSLGEGDVETVAPAQQLAFTFYGAGPFLKFQAEPGDRLTLYALSPSPFEMQALAGRIGRLYDYMADFFGDREGEYRVFARQHPYRGRGGTALPRSFTFGYHAPSNPTVDDLHGMLAHEIAHGWPSMQGEHGETAWYSEGAAEYYSLVLSHRAGVLDEDQFLDHLNRRAINYYTHSFRDLSNAEAAARFWTDPFVQQVPYGRGFLYLARTDGAIRAASHGRRSLDDVVLAMRERQVAGEPYGNDEWLELVAAEIGRDQAEQDYRDMVAGRAVRPGLAFSRCYLAVPVPARRFELGFARRSINEGQVRDLVLGSAAMRAGLGEGDRILDHTELSTLTDDLGGELRIEVERDGRRDVIRYLPRAEEVDAWRFTRRPLAEGETCGV